MTDRRSELELFLNIENIDVALISETRFTHRSHVNFNNYTTYRTDHPSGNSHGGTAVILKNHIKHHALSPYSTDKIQATSIKVHHSKNSETTISAIYCPPRHSLVANELKLFFDQLGSTFICGGDWNSKHTYWGSRLISPRGRQLYKTALDLNLECISHGKPTYWPTDPNKIPDLLDFYVIKNISCNYVKIEECECLSSDHNPVILNVYKQVIPINSTVNIYNKRTNWNLYKEIISHNIDLGARLKTGEDIEMSIERFNCIIHLAAANSTPTNNKVKVKQKEYPKQITQMVRERRKLRRIWQCSRYPSDKTAFNRVSQELKDLINEHDNLGVQSYLTKLTPHKDTNYSLWRATKNLKRPKNHIPPLRKQDSGWARSDTEKATEFAKHLQKVFVPLPSSDPENDSKVTEYLESPNQLCLPLKAVSPKEVNNEIKALPTGKAPGYDLLDSTLLKNLPKKGVLFLVRLFNACLRLSYYPYLWKLAQVVMLHKPDKPPEKVSSYRPISLLPLVGKLFEKLILKRMHPLLDTILPEHQFGFRQKHGTTEQVHRLVDTISNCLENKQYCSAVFLDISQAFDRVWHAGLLFKLKKHLPHSFYPIIKSYLDKRCFEVKHNGEISDLYEIQSGVPQGSILGPVLYLIFTTDIPATANTIMATYADDTALLSVDSEPGIASANVQAILNDIEKWLKMWRIKANEAKSAHVTFTLGRRDCPPVTLNGEQITHVDSVKYLGMHLDRRLTWQKHIWNKRKQLDGRLRSMNWLIGKRSQLSNNSKMAVYKTILKPVWTYGIELWGTASNSNIEILERFQSKAMRIMFNIPNCIANKYIIQDLKLNTVKQEISQRSQNYQKKLTKHVNVLAAKLSGSGSTQYKRLRRNSVPILPNRFPKL